MSAGQLTINAGDAQMYVYAANMIGGGEGFPFAEVEDEMPAVAEPRDGIPAYRIIPPRVMALSEQVAGVIQLSDTATVTTK